MYPTSNRLYSTSFAKTNAPGGCSILWDGRLDRCSENRKSAKVITKPQLDKLGNHSYLDTWRVVLSAMSHGCVSLVIPRVFWTPRLPVSRATCARGGGASHAKSYYLFSCVMESNRFGVGHIFCCDFSLLFETQKAILIP